MSKEVENKIQRRMNMFFKKKNSSKPMVLMHYEGLLGFKQDFPCKASADEMSVIFENENGGTAKLFFEQITSIDYMPETNFMGKYHNNPISTSKSGAVKWFSVVNYVSSSQENKYLAFWDVDSKGRKFFEDIMAKIPNKEIIL